jgi:predicted nuclease with TOPRIM domain
MPVAYRSGQQRLMEVNSDTMNSEVDVNILINHYHKKLSTLVNQNILLEAKMESMTKDYMDLKQKFDELQSPKRGIKK